MKKEIIYIDLNGVLDDFGKAKEGKILTPVLISQTGHKTQNDNAQILKEYWERQQKST